MIFFDQVSQEFPKLHQSSQLFIATFAFMMSRPKRQCRVNISRYAEAADSEDDYENILEDETNNEEFGDRNDLHEQEDVTHELLNDDELEDEQVHVMELDSDTDNDETQNETSTINSRLVSPSGIAWTPSNEASHRHGREPLRNIIRYNAIFAKFQSVWLYSLPK
jgi:hypothetical protein